MAQYEQDVYGRQNNQEKDPALLFEKAKQHLTEIMQTRKREFGVLPDPHTTLHNLGRVKGGVRYRNDGSKVWFEFIDGNTNNELLRIMTVKEDTERTYTFKPNESEIDISSGDYHLPVETQELAIADLDLLTTHLGNLAILATSKKAYS